MSELQENNAQQWRQADFSDHPLLWQQPPLLTTQCLDSPALRPLWLLVAAAVDKALIALL